MKTRRVTEILGSVSVEGKAYGPFSATADRPYLEVPAGVADVMAWPVHDSDPSLAQAEADAGEGTHVDEILKANEDLKADLDALHAAIRWTPDSPISPVAMVENIWGAAETNREKLQLKTTRFQELEAELDRERAHHMETRDQLAARQVRMQELQAELEAAQAVTPVAPAPVALPIDLRARIAALKNVSEAKADEIMDLLHEVLNPAPAVPEADAQ